MVGAKVDSGWHCNFLEKLAVCTNGRDAQVGAAEIDSNGKIRHGQKGIRKSLLIDG
jgi:hypothetical protein